jgi:pyrroline-5-carboxylate reductase
LKVAFLGAGNMGSALLQGALKSRFLKSSAVSVFDVDAKKAKALARKLKVRAAASNAEAVKDADYIFLCVKPQQMGPLLEEVRDSVPAKACLVSIAAGVPTGRIEKFFPRPAAVVRVMPNTPALVGRGMSAAAPGKNAKPAHLRFVTGLLRSVGESATVEEDLMDAVTAVSGSGPAYVFYLAESLALAAEAVGLPRQTAQQLARQTVTGAAKMLEGGEDPAELRRKVTSPGGTTEAALKHLSEQGWQTIFVQAVTKARNRSREL